MQQFVYKLELKHQVSIDEAEEALNNYSVIRRVARGNVNGEDVYAAYAHISNGRYLMVFFIRKKGNALLPISARDMVMKERRYYEKQK